MAVSYDASTSATTPSSLAIGSARPSARRPKQVLHDGAVDFAVHAGEQYLHDPESVISK
jgi:alcohol dehydrogenase YqhD (iron-dependent ADH family)